MTLHKEDDATTFECDDCGETETFLMGETFEDMIYQLKAEGWTITKEHGDWFHYCKECSSPPIKCV